MKTIAFFNEKGGVGKSTMSLMYASWLHYKHGVNVALADFNRRISEYRISELQTIKEQTGETDYLENHPEVWPIVTCLSKDINKISETTTFSPYGEWFKNAVRKNKFGDADVVICDFPGSFELGFKDCLAMSYLNYVAIPYIKEKTTLITTIKTISLLNTADKPFSVFLNKADMFLANSIKQYETHVSQVMDKLNFPLLPDVVLYSKKMDAMDKIDMVRSTLSWPDFDRPEYGKTADMGLVNLFIDITKELDKTPDLGLSDRKADLSFVYGLEKNKYGRQLEKSAFPDYYVKQ